MKMNFKKVLAVGPAGAVGKPMVDEKARLSISDGVRLADNLKKCIDTTDVARLCLLLDSHFEDDLRWCLMEMDIEDNGNSYHSNVALYAAAKGELACLELINDKYPGLLLDFAAIKSGETTKVNIFTVAALGGHLHVLDWLEAHLPETDRALLTTHDLSEDALVLEKGIVWNALVRGSVEVLDWANDRRDCEELFINTLRDELILGAMAIAGSDSGLKWVWDRSEGTALFANHVKPSDNGVIPELRDVLRKVKTLPVIVIAAIFHCQTNVLLWYFENVHCDKELMKRAYHYAYSIGAKVLAGYILLKGAQLKIYPSKDKAKWVGFRVIINAYERELAENGGVYPKPEGADPKVFEAILREIELIDAVKDMDGHFGRYKDE
jgi:hypothetical protein